ncbi:MAG: hypothetical protein LR000_00860 [Candidatus Pacebacteria bacterium]|nr:hypothetical protein [Candidatus Paceibacterota bacterium]
MIIRRAKENPILKPKSSHAWEAQAVFNGCPVKHRGKIYLIYRAVSIPHYHTYLRANMTTSDIGIAESRDGVHFENRRRLIVPEYDWEKFGCEDPRVTKLGKNFYIFYTALSEYPFRAEGIRVGVAKTRDLKKIEEKHLVTPFNSKAMALFPEKIKGKIWGILTVHTDKPPAKICLVSFDKENEIWSEKFWERWYKNFEEYSLPLQRRPQDHIEVGAPPLKTKYGWLLLYSYIRDYFSPQRIFGVEAVLLDSKNPFKIIGKIETPILTPEEYYEKIGLVPNVVFPSGAIIEKDWIYLYYGGADTVCCLALIKLSSLLETILQKDKQKIMFKRAKENPIIVPNRDHKWESKAVFNPAAIYLQEKVHIIYRALSDDDTSTLGYATSKDGIHIDYRSPQPIYVPREDFEKKNNPQCGSGCEDPRVTKIGNKIYMCYTAFNGIVPRVALTWIWVRDFLKRKWNWAKPILISPADLNDKNAFIFPEKVNGKYMIVHRVGYDIDYSFSKSLNFEKGGWLEEHRWIYRRKGWWDSKKVGAAAPPIKTKKGWIMFYHGISEDGVYRVGAVLLDLKNPTKILARTFYPLLEPETPYEKEGIVNNVVFPCGNVLLGNKIFLYYGGADKVVGVATIEVDDLLDLLKRCKC